MKKGKILVTGGAGFIGSEVVKILLKKNYSVRVVDDLSKKDSKKIFKDVEFIKGDLTKSSVAEKAMKGIDKCIHLAAKIGGIGYFHKFPATILSENNKMYSAVFEAAANEEISRILYLSSSMIFESTKLFPSKESDVEINPPPISAYGFSKLVGEWYCKSFLEERGLKYTICRPFNVYGINEYPGEYVGYAHVIPDLIKKIDSGQYPLELLGNGKQTRCFTHISDLARGVIMALESNKTINQDINLGTMEETRMIDLAKMLWKLCGRKENFKVKYVEGFRFDVKRRVPSNIKAKKLIGWTPQMKLEKELPLIIEWLRSKK